MLSRNHGSHFEKAKTAFEEGAANKEPIFDESVEQSRLNRRSGVVIMNQGMRRVRLYSMKKYED